MSGELLTLDMCASKAFRSSGSSGVKAAIRTPSGSRICSNKASRSPSSTGAARHQPCAHLLPSAGPARSLTALPSATVPGAGTRRRHVQVFLPRAWTSWDLPRNLFMRSRCRRRVQARAGRSEMAIAAATGWPWPGRRGGVPAPGWAGDEVEHVSKPVRGVDAPMRAGLKAQAKAGSGCLECVDRRLGRVVWRAGDPEFLLVPQVHARLIADLDRAGRSPKSRQPSWMIASSACQDRSELS